MFDDADKVTQGKIAKAFQRLQEDIQNATRLEFVVYKGEQILRIVNDPTFGFEI